MPAYKYTGPVPCDVDVDTSGLNGKTAIVTGGMCDWFPWEDVADRLYRCKRSRRSIRTSFGQGGASIGHSTIVTQIDKDASPVFASSLVTWTWREVKSWKRNYKGECVSRLLAIAVLILDAEQNSSNVIPLHGKIKSPSSQQPSRSRPPAAFITLLPTRGSPSKMTSSPTTPRDQRNQT